MLPALREESDSQDLPLSPRILQHVSINILKYWVLSFTHHVGHTFETYIKTAWRIILSRVPRLDSQTLQTASWGFCFGGVHFHDALCIHRQRRSSLLFPTLIKDRPHPPPPCLCLVSHGPRSFTLYPEACLTW